MKNISKFPLQLCRGEREVPSHICWMLGCALVPVSSGEGRVVSGVICPAGGLGTGWGESPPRCGLVDRRVWALQKAVSAP